MVQRLKTGNPSSGFRMMIASGVFGLSFLAFGMQTGHAQNKILLPTTKSTQSSTVYREPTPQSMGGESQNTSRQTIVENKIVTEEGTYYPEANLFIPAPKIRIIGGTRDDKPKAKTETSTSKSETSTSKKSTVSKPSTTSTKTEVKTETSSVKSTPKASKTSTAETEETASKKSEEDYSDQNKQYEYYDEKQSTSHHSKDYQDQMDAKRQEEASHNRISSQNRAKALLDSDHQMSSHNMNQNEEAAGSMMSDQPRPQIDFAKTDALSASIGSFLKQDTSSAPGGQKPEEDEPVCAAPEIADELQKQLDKEKKELEDAIEEAEEKLKERRKKLKWETDADEKNPKRKKIKEAQDQIDEKEKDLRERGEKIREQVEQQETEKAEVEDKIDKARRGEQEARRGPPADPNCRSAKCQGFREDQADARKEKLNLEKKHAKAQRQLEKDISDFQKDMNQHNKNKAQLEAALDRGYGLTKEQWEGRVLEKKTAALEEMRDTTRERKEKLYRKYADKEGNFKNPGVRREYERLDKEYDAIVDEYKKFNQQSKDFNYNLEKQGIPTAAESLDYMRNSEAAKKELAAIDSSLENLEAAKNRIQNFQGQPDMEAAQEQLDAQKTADAKLEAIEKEASEYFKNYPKEPPNPKKELQKAESRLRGLQRDKDATYQDKQTAQREVERLEREQAKYESWLDDKWRDYNEKYKDKLKSARDEARIAGIGAIGAHAQDMVSQYNRGIPDVLGPDGKVDPVKVTRYAAKIDQQLLDVAKVNAEVDALNQVKGNLLPGADGQKSLAEQAGMSPKAIKTRLGQIDERLKTARGYQEQLQSGLEGFGFKSEINPEGQCSISSVNSAFGAAYVKGARQAIERKKNAELKTASAFGTASPAAGAIAKNAKNVEQAKQAEQYKMSGSGGGGSCVGKGAPVASCAESAHEGRRAAPAKEFMRVAAASFGGIGGAVLAELADERPELGGLSYLDAYVSGINIDELTTLVSQKSKLDQRIESRNQLLETAERGGAEEELLIKQRLEYIAKRDALELKIKSLTDRVAATTRPSENQPAEALKDEDIKVSTDEVIKRYKTAIEDLNAGISSVEEMMSATAGSNIMGLLPSLEVQREALFAARYALEEKLAELEPKKTTETGLGETAERAPEAGSNRAELIAIRNALEEKILGLSQTSEELEKSGSIQLANVLKTQVIALQGSRDAVEEQLRKPENSLNPPVVSSEKASLTSAVYKPELDTVVAEDKLIEIVQVLTKNIEVIRTTEEAFKEAGQPVVASVFTNQRKAMEAARNQVLRDIKTPPEGPARTETGRLFRASIKPGETVQTENAPDLIELQRTAALVDWINKGLLPAFEKNDAAKRMLPSVLNGLIKRFGATKADEILDGIADQMEDEGIRPSAALFLDELLRQINDETRAQNSSEQNLLADRARAQYLREMLANKDKSLSKEEIEILQSSLDKLKPKLASQMEKRLAGLDNKPLEITKALAELTEILALPSTEDVDLRPTLAQISRQLERLEKTGQIVSKGEGKQVAEALKASLTALQKSLPETPRARAHLTEISKLLVRVNDELAKAYAKEAAGLGNEKEAVRRYALSRLDQSRHLLKTGDFKAALDLINGVVGPTAESGKQDVSIELAKAMALVDTLNTLENVYGLLPEKQRQELGDLKKLLEKRDNAIAIILENSTNPRLVSALLLGNAERLRQQGKFSEALSVVETALEKNPSDEVLIATKLKLKILSLGSSATKEQVAEELARLPEEQRLTSSLVALNNLTVDGDENAAKALIEALRELKGVPKELQQRVEIQIDYAEISILASKLGMGGDDKLLERRLGVLKAKLKESKTLDETYKQALLSSSEKLLQQILQARKWEAASKSNTIPLPDLLTAAREAMSAGRYDIAGPAMSHLMDRLLKEAGNDKVLAGFVQTARMLDHVRMRLAAGGLTSEQSKVFEKLLETHGGDIEKKLKTYMAERVRSAGNYAKTDAENGKAFTRANAFRLEMRQLAQLQTRLELLTTPPSERLNKLNELRRAAAKRVSDYEQSIRDDFEGRGTLLRDKAYDKAILQRAIAELNQLRAARDGVEDYYYENAGVFTMSDDRGELRYGTFRPKNHREYALTNMHRQIAGVYAYGTSATEIWRQRKDYSRTAGRGLREKYIAHNKNEPREREYEADRTKYKDFWLIDALNKAELDYMDQRRMELINEDPNRSIPEKAKLYDYFLTAEAKYLEALVGSSNPLLEMFEQIAQTGRLMRGAASELKGRVIINDKNQLLNEYQSAFLDKDAQRLFRALVPLRDASLAGEFKAFVDYLHKDWYEVGPAWFYNRSVGEDATQTALEQITAETQKVQIALIRAGNNLPGQLSETDQRILERHGFLKDGKYTIPEQIKLDPTKVASEFVALTETGRLATLDRFLNVKMGAELFATVALPGGLAAKFGRSVTMEMLALGGIRSLTGKALAYGTGLAAEAGAFTILSRGARTALDPSIALQEQFWSRDALVKEYAHNLLIIGALKGFGKVSQEVARRAKSFGNTAAKVNSLGRAASYTTLMAEAGLLTGLNGLLESNKITQDDYLGNLLTIVLLKGTNKVLEGGEKSGSTRLQEARINKILSYMGKPPVPGTTPITRVSQIRESIIREVEYRDWLLNVDKPTRLLLEQFNGDWAAARSAFQKGEISESQMRKLVQLRRHIVDTLAAEIVSEVGGKFEAFGSENLTSDYDISFVGPNRALAVYLFNARFANRWGVASRLGGRETGVVLDTNAYTETIQSLIEAGIGDTVFQDAFAHLARRKYGSDAEWSQHRKWVLENTPQKSREDVARMLDFVEAANLEYKTAIELKMAELSQNKENPVREADLRITAENRLYEDALLEIKRLQDAFEKASGDKKEALRLDLRNAQSKALYFAQEAYHTQAAIEHVVMSIQAAKRKITVESLTADTPPKLEVNLTKEQGRQSYLEQIANMMKELSHGGDIVKLATKGAKYFIRALDAAQIAGVKLAEYKDLIEQVVALDANRADLAKVRELLVESKIKAIEEARGFELTKAERKQLAEEVARQFLEDIQNLSNKLTAELYQGQALEVVDLMGIRQINVKTEQMNTRDIIQNIDRPTEVLMERYEGNWDAARKDYQKGILPATEMRLLVNLRRRIVDSLAAEIIRELGGEVQAFGSENLTSDYDISFVGPKAQLAVILFNARFAAGWGMASKIGGRETGVVLDTNAYTETVQSLVKAGSGDIAFQDAFAHLAGRKYMADQAWSQHKKMILESTPEANRADVEKVLNWAEKANDSYKSAIEAKKAELRADESLKLRESDLQITAENRLYEQALQEIFELREQFESASGEAKEGLRLKLRNAQSKALYFAQEAYHTQGAIEHVVMSIQAAKRKITAETLLSETPPKLKVELTKEQGRQSYFEQVANMMKEISHSGDAAKLASKGAKYFVRALDAAQIAGLKLGALKEVVELTVALNDNRADLNKVGELLAKEALEAAAREKGGELSKQERSDIIEKAGRDYLDAIQEAANQLTGELYKGQSLEVVDVEGVRKFEINLPEPANDNVAEKVVSEGASSPKSGEVSSEAIPKPRVLANSVRGQREIAFRDGKGGNRLIELGEYVASGATSLVYRLMGNENLAVRITKSGDWDARRLDEYGREVLESHVDNRFIRIVRRVATYDITSTSNSFFESRKVQSLEVTEFMKQGTAEAIIERQGGTLTEGQRYALDQAIRELNRKGFAWLDNKYDNYTFERAVEGKDLWRVVVLDPGGIVPVVGVTGYQRYVIARALQSKVNILTADMREVLESYPDAGRKFVAAEIRGLIKNEHANDVREDILGIPFKEVAYSPVGVFTMPRVQEMFALDNAAANDNYEAFVKKELTSVN
ncbi:hypothetical protein [Sneathiella limimaris]|uniref:hypothetical protein n=1 Tax=Sneathiella limimaris TaxID=1964213 RepID=UPI00146CCD96|nr:hypothetical protein [Sneathiella limimaris]